MPCFLPVKTIVAVLEICQCKIMNLASSCGREGCCIHRKVSSLVDLGDSGLLDPNTNMWGSSKP